MQIHFIVGNAVDEAASLAALDGNYIADEHGVMNGSLKLSQTGASDVVIEDDLQFLVINFCLRMPAQLAAEGKATVRMASMPRRVTLRKEGDSVRLTDHDGAEMGPFPYPALQRALRECAERYTGYIHALGLIDPSWISLENMLRASLADSGARSLDGLPES